MVASSRSEAPELPDELLAGLEAFVIDGTQEGAEWERAVAVAGQVQELLAEATGGHRQIDTRSGRKVVPLELTPEEVELEDIAHGLSNVGRFAGQGRRFYSVARHSVHVCLEVEAMGGNKTAQRWGLLHDATEAYLSDVPGPVKRSLPGYKHVERRLDMVITEALDLELDDKDEHLVEEADGRVGQYELATEFPNADHEEPDLRHDPDTVGQTKSAKELFSDQAADLGFR